MTTRLRGDVNGTAVCLAAAVCYGRGASMSVSSYRLGGDDADRRLDRLLRKLFPDVPLSGLYRAIRTGAVTVNHRRAAPALRTRQGDLLIVDLAAAPRGAATTGDRAAATTVAANAAATATVAAASRAPAPPLPVVVDLQDALVINKPSGLPMSGGGDSVVGRLRRHLPDSPSLTFQPSPVHQLDRMTSGALLVATTLRSSREWSRRFATRAVDKRYLALVEGKCRAGRWRDRMRFDRSAAVAADGGAAEDGGGREATLRCAPLAFSPGRGGAGLTLLLIRLETGRRHQIRAQAAWRGHPVHGDSRYGARPRRGGGPLLHAWQLSCSEARLSATAALADRQLRDLERIFPDVRAILRDARGYRL